MALNKIRVSVIGAGGWGTSLAGLLSSNGHDVAIWAFESEVAQEINKLHTNTTYLPGITLPTEVIAYDDLEAISGADYYVIAVPSQHIRNLPEYKTTLFDDKPVINVAKGIERRSLLRVSELLEDCAGVKPANYVVLTGPSHAEEVSRQLATTVVAASENLILAREVQKLFTNSYFRVYSSDDVIGCEIGGALKNVIAIAAGIIDGAGLGDNTKAALITRGLAEMSRLGVSLGANSLTFSGLSGLGDLFVTCNSRHSRNRWVGEQIGRGKTLKDITNETRMIAEGVSTTESAFFLGRQHGVEMPIAEQVYKILFEDVQPLVALNELMSRQSKREWWW